VKLAVTAFAARRLVSPAGISRDLFFDSRKYTQIDFGWSSAQTPLGELTALHQTS